MKAVFAALNRLVADGVIEDYAIGGAIAAASYIEALQTEDVDAFVFLPETASGGLVSLSPIYAALVALGGIPGGEHVRFGEWPLQILTDANPLVREAIRAARQVDYEGTPTRVFRAEHLCAIALQTGRAKDYLRVEMFLSARKVDLSTLAELCDRYGLDRRLEKARRLHDGEG